MREEEVAYREMVGGAKESMCEGKGVRTRYHGTGRVEGEDVRERVRRRVRRRAYEEEEEDVRRRERRRGCT